MRCVLKSKKGSLLQKLLCFFILTFRFLLLLHRHRAHHLTMLSRVATWLSNDIRSYLLERLDRVVWPTVEIFILSLTFTICLFQLLPSMGRRTRSLFLVRRWARSSWVIFRIPRTTTDGSVKDWEELLLNLLELFLVLLFHSQAFIGNLSTILLWVVRGFWWVRLLLKIVVEIAQLNMVPHPNHELGLFVGAAFSLPNMHDYIVISVI
jgi:hypothetical protein